ncbi:MAG: dipeptide ABC transporter ATP-binding protein [Candidatus Promineifilaceae bacterium]
MKAATAVSPLLEVCDLTVAYEHGGELLTAVRDFDLRILPGQTYGLVGESGSGKSTVALAIMRYLGENGRIVSGSVRFGDLDLLALDDSGLRNIWGKEIAFVPQDPQSALNPSMRTGEQIAEILRRHMGLKRSEAAARSEELLHTVRVPDPDRVMKSFPHQISGGMQQRVLIAMALSTEPRLLILDEPTTGLDVTTQAAILDLFRELTTGRQTAVLYVTHNLGVVANLCDRVAVLYAGELVEDSEVGGLFSQPLHPYTEGLLESIPQIGQTRNEVTLEGIPGHIPPLGERTQGCVFTPRCWLAVEACAAQRPSLDEPAPGRLVRCHRWPELLAGDITLQREFKESAGQASPASAEQVLVIEDLEVYFKGDRSFADFLRHRPRLPVRAVDGVDLRLARSHTLGIVGESGSGKTTLARAVVGLSERTGGEITLLDILLPPDLASRDDDLLRHLQYVFQNPDEALNPHLTVGQTLSRPFVTLLGYGEEEANQKVASMLEAVSLPASYALRYPTQLSGGEKQRVAIARAFATSPDLLLADEPVSALDVSVQASILNLLHDLQDETHNALIFISHDLAVVGYLADQIAVMYLGQIMEVADAEGLFSAPMHPYTEALLSAVPQIKEAGSPAAIPLEGEVPSQINKPSGCPFHTRCPRFLGDICRTAVPPWQVTASGNRIYCHIPLDDLATAQKGRQMKTPASSSLLESEE